MHFEGKVLSSVFHFFFFLSFSLSRSPLKKREHLRIYECKRRLTLALIATAKGEKNPSDLIEFHSSLTCTRVRRKRDYDRMFESF